MTCVVLHNILRSQYQGQHGGQEHKILPGNIFGLILKNKMVATDVFRLSARSFIGPPEQRVL